MGGVISVLRIFSKRLEMISRLGASLLRPLRAGSVRMMSTQKELVTVDICDQTGIATLRMNSPPVNIMSTAFLQRFDEALVDASCDAKGIIVMSAHPPTFSAGLDIMEMYKPTEESLKVFWGSLQEMWFNLYTCQVPVIALINGHAPAGGCLLACTSDHRVMVREVNGKPAKIGLNETKLGITAPAWFRNTMRNVIGQRETERALQLGILYSAAEAYEIGMIDDLVESEEEGMKVAIEVAKEYIKIPAMARGLTKLDARKDTIDEFNKIREMDLKQFVSFIPQPMVQKQLGKYIESLKKKK